MPSPPWPLPTSDTSGTGPSRPATGPSHLAVALRLIATARRGREVARASEVGELVARGSILGAANGMALFLHAGAGASPGAGSGGEATGAGAGVAAAAVAAGVGAAAAGAGAADAAAADAAVANAAAVGRCGRRGVHELLSASGGGGLAELRMKGGD